MEPLKSRDKTTSPIEAAAVALLRSAERYQPPAGLKQRVRMRLLATPSEGGRSRRRPRAAALRPALIAVGVLIAAGASAMGGKWLLANLVDTSQSNQELQATSLARTDARGVSRSAARTPAASAPASPLASNDLSELGLAGTSENPAAHHEPTGSSDPTPARADTTSRAPAASEKGLVFDAMRALRREAQPERAARLLDEYLRRYPRGSLAEEALALAIEAHSALGDPRTKGLADRYLTSYPAGRFRPAALRARARFSP